MRHILILGFWIGSAVGLGAHDDVRKCGVVALLCRSASRGCGPTAPSTMGKVAKQVVANLDLIDPSQSKKILNRAKAKGLLVTIETHDLRIESRKVDRIEKGQVFFEGDHHPAIALSRIRKIRVLDAKAKVASQKKRAKLGPKASFETINKVMAEGNESAQNLITRFSELAGAEYPSLILGLNDMNIRGPQIEAAWRYAKEIRDEMENELQCLLRLVQRRDANLAFAVNRTMGPEYEHKAVPGGASR